MRSCTLCASEFEPGHGNARYCDLCRMSVCARCHKPFRRSQPHKVAYYCSPTCRRNDTLRDYIEENQASVTAMDVASRFGISRQRVYQVCAEQGIRLLSRHRNNTG